MFQAPTVCSLQHLSARLGDAHPHYSRLVGLACAAHAGGRNPDAFTAEDIARARLYCHAFRRQSIGAFHATRVALEEMPDPTGAAALHRLRAREILADLGNLAIDPIPHDHRALLGPFYRYEYGLQRALQEMEEWAKVAADERVNAIADRFIARIRPLRSGPSLETVRDDVAPEQGGFVVPGLGITIFPLVYGDHHSWNLAWLDPRQSDVPHHRHFHGVEIHLGYGPMAGHVVLGDCRTRMTEGYALPIPPDTRHGYINDSPLPHNLPFIFGSMKRGGWGVFFDVDPRPVTLGDLREVPLEDSRMNGLLRIEHEILKATRLPFTRRAIVLPAHRTDRNGTGGLQLTLTRVREPAYALKPERFLAFSVVSGKGSVTIAGITRNLEKHDHFGLPAGLEALFASAGDEPFILLDADLVPSGKNPS